jgi:hypothetical protein
MEPGKFLFQMNRVCISGTLVGASGAMFGIPTPPRIAFELPGNRCRNFMPPTNKRNSCFLKRNEFESDFSGTNVLDVNLQTILIQDRLPGITDNTCSSTETARPRYSRPSFFIRFRQQAKIILARGNSKPIR